MKVFVADDTGLVKMVGIEKSEVVAKWGTQDRAFEIVAMAFKDNSESEVGPGILPSLPALVVRCTHVLK